PNPVRPSMFRAIAVTNFTFGLALWFTGEFVGHRPEAALPLRYCYCRTVTIWITDHARHSLDGDALITDRVAPVFWEERRGFYRRFNSTIPHHSHANMHR
ncbi:hypothetical protein, partial [Brucella sp. 22210]|uniref:hypothetical protein n=1 Tax=Brucella sp. 22210 TaxID=3453892 RepID=UPI003F856A20